MVGIEQWFVSNLADGYIWFDKNNRILIVFIVLFFKYIIKIFNLIV